jgi:peroxiredoxin
MTALDQPHGEHGSSSPEFVAALERLIERLRRCRIGETAPKPGEPLPAFALPDRDGHMVKLEWLLQRGPLAVTFHSGYWCPCSRSNIHALARAHDRILAEGGQVIAIMPDGLVRACKVQPDLPFPILTDTDSGYALSLNLAIWIGSEMQAMIVRGSPSTDTDSLPAMLPIPASFVVGADGRVRARFIELDYRKPTAIADMLEVLRS